MDWFFLLLPFTPTVSVSHTRPSFATNEIVHCWGEKDHVPNTPHYSLWSASIMSAQDRLISTQTHLQPFFERCCRIFQGNRVMSKQEVERGQFIDPTPHDYRPHHENDCFNQIPQLFQSFQFGEFHYTGTSSWFIIICYISRPYLNTSMSLMSSGVEGAYYYPTGNADVQQHFYVLSQSNPTKVGANERKSSKRAG